MQRPPSELEGLINAARQLGLPLPRLPVELGSSLPVQRSAPARLGAHSPGTSPGESGSPRRSVAKRSFCSAGALSDAGEDCRQLRRRRLAKDTVLRMVHRNKGRVPQSDKARALADCCRHLQEAHQVASARIVQLQGEVSHWHAQAQSLAHEAQQLRQRVALYEMAARQQLAQPGHLLAQPEPVINATTLGWDTAPVQSAAAPVGCLPVQPDPAAYLMSGTALPTCAGLPTPAGPLPTLCDTWDDVLLPDFPL